MPAPVLQVRRGALSNLPGLRAGEPAFTTDTFDLYVGIDSTTNNNKFLGSNRYWRKETASLGSGIRLVEATGGSDYITLAAPASVGAAITYTFPATITDGYYLKTNASGQLSWGEVVSQFNIAADSGTPDTVSTGSTITFTGGTNVNTAVTDNTITVNLDNNISLTGIGTFTGGIVADSVRVGITSNTVETTSGKLTLSSATGTVEVTNHLDVLGDLDVSGNVYIGGTTVTLRGTDVFIENKDIVLGYATSITPSDTSANHAGVAIASTEGTPLVSFSASGINTLPDTYKQMMWFKSGTLGFATDAFAFNYGLAIGTTSMASGDRLAVGTGIRMTDTTITATTFNGSLSGNASSSDQVKTINASNTNATYYVTFVDANNGSATNETVYTDDGIYYNPGTNTFTTQYGYFTGNVTVDGSIIGTATTATRATTVDVVGVATNQNYYITLVDSSGNSKSVGVDAELLYNPNTNTFTVGTGVGVTQFSSAVGSGNSSSSVPTSSAVIDYVGTQIGNVDLTTSLAADGPTTGSVSTSGTLTISGTANEVETSVSGSTFTIGLPDTVNVTTLLDVPTIEVTNVKAKDGTTSITISNTTGAVGFANSVTISGDLYVLGTTTEINTSTLKVEDTLVDLGLVNDNGVLVPPSSDLNLDIGILLNWYSGSAKKASVYWDDSAQRIGIASDVTESSGVLTANAYAAVEIGALWVTDCAGTSQVISCTGSERFLENITIDAGTF